MLAVLQAHGYQFHRRARGTHEIWAHESGATILVTRSGLQGRARQNWLANFKRATALEQWSEN
jgi:predicted RNA binding protein YcfA (HicA-like mRNA interferase family)